MIVYIFLIKYTLDNYFMNTALFFLHSINSSHRLLFWHASVPDCFDETAL